jgi:hypothetical protein
MEERGKNKLETKRQRERNRIRQEPQGRVKEALEENQKYLADRKGGFPRQTPAVHRPLAEEFTPAATTKKEKREREKNEYCTLVLFSRIARAPVVPVFTVRLELGLGLTIEPRLI